MRMITPAVPAAFASAFALAFAAGCASASPSPAGSPAETSTATSLTSAAAKTGGCRDVYLYGAADEDATRVVVVDVDARALGLKKGDTRTFDLANAPPEVKVWLDVYLQPAHIDQVHCTRHPTEPQMAERYAATSGTLVIGLAGEGIATAEVQNARFALDGRPAIEVASRRFDRVKLARSSP